MRKLMRAVLGKIVPPETGQLFRDSFEQMREEFGQGFDDRRAVIDPGPGVDINRPPAEIEDALQREAIVRGERSARISTRRPFHAPEPPELELRGSRPRAGRSSRT